MVDRSIHEQIVNSYIFNLSYENLIEMFLCYFISVLINNAIHLSILFYLIFFSDADHRGINFVCLGIFL
mgnify:CR=1 FL=1